MPKISVIIPVYNSEQYLKECLDNVVNQTLKDIEIICINDGSTDASLKILEEYAARDSRIRFLNQENKGSASARNLGIKEAKGHYIGFVDSDDIINNLYFEVLYKAAVKNGADIAATSNCIIFGVSDNVNNVKKITGLENKSIIKDIKDKAKIITTTGMSCNKIYKRDFLIRNNISCLELKNAAEDNYFTDCTIIKANKIAVSNKAVYFYRKNKASQTQALKDESSFSVMDVYKAVDSYILKQNFRRKEKEEWLNIIKERKLIDYCNFKDTMENSCKTKFSQIFREAFFKELKPVVVSLTSYPARINTVHKTIESLLSQTFKADKIILNLGEDKFPNKEKDLPKELLDLVPKGLEINWCIDIRSYTKLLPVLKKHPDSIIITVDDDLLYPKHLIRKLVCAYIKKPEYIHCHRAHLILFDRRGKIKPYGKWVKEALGVKPSFNNFLTGVGGVLYPPNVLYKDVFDEEKFKRLAPMADDIWFWAMAVLNGTKINVIKNNIPSLEYIEGTQENGLYVTNITKNDEQLQNVLSEYPEILKKLEKIKSYDGLTFWQRIFSVRNEKRPNRKYKVINVLGVKLKFKIKEKTNFMKKMEYWEYKKPDFRKHDVIRLTKEFDKFWKKIERKENFTLLRYGDGERAMMSGESVKAQEGWESPNKIGKLGLDLLGTLNLTNNNVYYGISCPCCDPRAYYWYSSRIQNKNRTFANLWVNKNYCKFIKHFNKLKRDAVLIANYRAKGAKIGNLNILAHYEIGDDCVSFWENEASNLIQKIKNDWGDKNNILYVVSAGPMAEPIIAELYKNNPNNCYIDFGSVLDEYYKETSRPYMTKGAIYAKRNCWMDNPDTTNFDVSVVLNLYKRPENLKLQLEAIETQSLKPKEIILYQDGTADGSKIEIPEDIKNRFNKIIVSNENKGVWERFRVAKEHASSKYVSIFDDDTIPGSRWLENCHFEMINKEGLYGTIGILTNNIAAYPLSGFFKAGWDNPLDGTVEVDLVGHSWFFKREWLDDLFSVPKEIQKFKIAGEDMSFSYALLKNRGIKTFVPPHPKDKLEFFGSNPTLAHKLGTSECAISMNNDNYKTMNKAVKILLDNGWKTLEKRNPLYIEHVKACIKNGKYVKFSFLKAMFSRLFNVYNKNNRKIIKIFTIKISLKEK